MLVPFDPRGGVRSLRRAVPNCTAKAKGEKQVLVGDMLLDSRDIGQLSLRRPFDRVSAQACCCMWVLFMSHSGDLVCLHLHSGCCANGLCT